jgi:hypothetical protein
MFSLRSTITATITPGCDSGAVVSARRRAVAAVLLGAALVVGACTSGPGQKSFCDSLKGPNPLDVFNAYDPSNASDAHAVMQQGVDRLKQLGAAAPAEIRDAIASLVDVAQQLSTALEQRSSNPTTASIPDFSKRTAEITQASAAVTSYASTNCGVQLDPSVTTTTSAAPPPSG